MKNKGLAPPASQDRVTDERSREGASPPSGSVPTGAGTWLTYKMNSRTLVTTQDRRGFYRCTVIDQSGDIIAEVRGKTEAKAHEHARLIAAAPDLYEALKRLVAAIGDTGADDEVIAAVAAIKKARGE